MGARQSMGEDSAAKQQPGCPWDSGQLILHPCHTIPVSSLSHASALPQECNRSELVLMEWFEETHMSSPM